MTLIASCAAALVMAYGLSLVVTAGRSWPAGMKSLPPTARRWVGAGVLLVGAYLLAGPFVLSADQPNLSAASVFVVTGAPACWLVADFVRYRHLGEGARRIGVLYLCVGTLGTLVCILSIISDAGDLVRAFAYWGPALSLSALCGGLGLVLLVRAGSRASQEGTEGRRKSTSTDS